MKVLLLFPMKDGQTGSAIKHAFEQIGHEVMAVDAKTQVVDSFPTANYFSDDPDLVFCSRTYQLTEHVEKIKKRFPYAKVCMWNVDTRTTIDRWSHLFPLIRLVDYYFVVASRLIPDWRRLNPNTFWLPQGLQDEVYDKPKDITVADREKYSCDVSFAGRERGVRRSFFDAIDKMGIDFKRWGCGGAPKIYNEEHNKMVSLSKINLCCSGWTGNGKYTSVRNYKIMGAGGFALELYRKGIYDIFPTDSLHCYRTALDLVEQVRYWLENEKYREQAAEKGYRWVHGNATYTHRIKEALEIMGL